MAKTQDRTDRAITKVGPTNAGYLAKYAGQQDTSLDTMSGYMIVPRMKIIQGMSGEDLKKVFGEGSAIIRPGDSLVARKEEPFLFVPQFFFPEWCKWSDRRDTESRAILERSYDPTSNIAKRAANPEQRFEIYTDPDQSKKPDDKKWKYRYVHHFVFLGVIYGAHGLASTPVALSFEKGEFGQGRNFITACKLRKIDLPGPTPESPTVKAQAPLWSQVWRLYPKLRVEGEKKWWGFNFECPEPEKDNGFGPYIREDEMEAFHGEHANLAKMHESRRIIVEGEHDDDEPGPGENPGDSKEF